MKEAFRDSNSGQCVRGPIDTQEVPKMLVESIQSYGGMRHHQHAGKVFATGTHAVARLLDKEGMSNSKYYCETEEEESSATIAEGGAFGLQSNS